MGDAAQDLAGHVSGGEKLVLLYSLYFFGFISISVIFPLFLITFVIVDCKLLNCIYLGPQIFSPHPTEGGVSESCMALSSQLSLSHVQNHVRKLSLCHLNFPRKMMEMHRSHET